MELIKIVSETATDIAQKYSDIIFYHKDSGFPPKIWKIIPWFFPDFQRKFPDHFIDNWLSIHIVCKYIRQIPVSEIANSICYLYCILNAADVTLEHNKNIIENEHVHFHIGEFRDK